MRVCKLLLFIVLFLAAFVAKADYDLPDDVGSGPFTNCSNTSGYIYCSGNLIINDNNIDIHIDDEVTLEIEGDLTFGNGVEFNAGGDPDDLTIIIGGNLNPGNNAELNANLSVAGSINTGNNSEFEGDLQISGNLNLGNNSEIQGNVSVSGSLNTGNNVTIEGNVQATNVSLGSNNEIDGNINATGSVNIPNNSTVTGYVNAPSISNPDAVEGEVCNTQPTDGNTSACDDGDTFVEEYRVIYSSPGVTCQPFSVTVQACGDASCSVGSPEPVAFDLVATGPDTVVASGVVSTSTQVPMNIPVAGAYTLEIQPTESPAQEVVYSTGGGAFSMTDSAFFVSSSSSVVSGNTFPVEIEAIETNTSTGACQAALDGTTDINVTISCDDPASGAQCNNNASFPDARLVVNGNVINGSSSVNVSGVAFNQGVATLDVAYRDVGEISFTVDKTVATGAQLTGTKFAIQVAPASFDVIAIDSPLNPLPTTICGDESSIFRTAGEEFTVEVISRSSFGNVTPSFGTEFSAEQPTLTPQVTVVAPIEVNGDTAVAEPSLDGINAPAIVSPGTFRFSGLSWRDVGVIEVSASLDDYMDTNIDVNGQSAPVGRFIPAYFDVTLVEQGVETITPEFADGHEDFTYIGQPFGWEVAPEFYVTPRTLPYGASGHVIKNYVADFFCLTADDAADSQYTGLNLPAGTQLESSGINGSDIILTVPDVFNKAAELQLDDERQFIKPVEPLLPFNPEFLIEFASELFTDQDGVCFLNADDTFQDCQRIEVEAVGTQQVTGRLNLLPAYGPSEAPLPLQFQTELFACSGSIAREDVVDVNGEAIACSANDQGWRRNLRDITGDDKDATAYSVDWLTEASLFVARPEADSGLVGALDFSLSPLVTEFLVGGRPEPGLELVVESGGLRGIVDWELNLDDPAVALPWLKHDWNESSTLSNPSTELEFGISSENRRILFQRETGW